MNLRFHFLILPLLGASAAQAQDKTAGFESPQAVAGWETSGHVAVDAAKDRGGAAGGALKIGPGAKAIWPLRPGDGSGRVEMWVYEDGTVPAQPKDRRAGPRWGVIQADGRVLVAGAIYAPYLAGDTTYATSDSDQKSWFDVQYLGLKRTPGWHQWIFDFDASKGLSILQDGKKTRFDWNKSQIKGFRGIAVFGDEDKPGAQTIWVDDVSAQLGGEMKSVPVLPPPPPPTEPAQDPKPDKPVELLPAVRNQHPRLLFTPAQVPAMKAYAQRAGKPYMDQLLQYLPSCVPPADTKWASDATDAQRQGFWRLPTVALHYVLTGERTSLERAVGYLQKFAAAENWETGAEQDSGMASANIMAGAALAYDWLYNDLDPAFRNTFRKKLLLQARRQYHRGHLMKAPGTHYWQNDPQNNHRWHRNAGLALAVLTVAGDGPEDDWILAKTREELQFIHDWLPEDGTSHESSSYMTFGAPYLVLAFDASDRCLGTDFLGHPFFKNVSSYRIHTLAPGFQEVFHYGDSDGVGFIHNYLLKTTSRHRQPDELAALQEFAKVQPSAFAYGWFSLIWADPTLQPGSVDRLPKEQFFPDLGMLTVRDGWGAQNVGLMFKCSPYGGEKLNEFRNKNNTAYINVAHDDPDANMFSLYANGALLADDDRYATAKKVSSSHNTILVNGKGQKGEGTGWTQPLRGADADMSKLARIMSRKSSGDVSFIEGEAGRTYTDLNRYRRAVVWVKGSYVLLLDDIGGIKENEITWLVQGKGVSPVQPEQGRFQLKNGAASCDFQIVADQPFTHKIGISTAENRGKPLGWEQLQAMVKASRWRVVTVFNPWQRGQLQVKMEPAGEGQAKVTVQGADFTDVWDWSFAPGADMPSVLKGNRKGGFKFDSSVK